MKKSLPLVLRHAMCNLRGGFLIRRGLTIQPQTMNTMTAADQFVQRGSVQGTLRF